MAQITGPIVKLTTTGDAPAAQAVTVPSDAEGAIVFYNWWSSSGGADKSVTSCLSTFSGAFTLAQLPTSDAGSGKNGVCVGMARVTSTGSKTFTPLFSGVPNAGPNQLIVFVKGIPPTGDWYRLTGSGGADPRVWQDTSGTTNISGTIPTAGTDLVIAMDACDGTTLPGNATGWTTQDSQVYNSLSALIRTANSPGASTTTTDTQRDNYATLAMVAVMDSGGSTQNLAFPLTTNTSTVYPPTVVQSGSTQNLTFPLTTNTSTIYAPTVRQIPVLSSISATARTNALIRAQATTNVATGTLYAVWTTTSTQPSAAQIMAGQNHTGAAASAAANVAVSSTGAKTLDGTGLTQLQLYYQWVFHSVGGGLGSNIGASTATTFRNGDTAANILANTGPVGGNPAGTLYALAGTLAADDWMAYRTISGPTPSGGTLTEYPDGRFTYVGGAAAVWVIQPEVNGVDDGGGTTTVNLYDQTLTQTLAFPLTTNTSAVYPPTVLRGTVTLGFPLTTNTSTVYPPTVVQAGATQNLAFPLTTNTSTVYPPTAVQGAGGTQTLTFPLTTNTSTVYPPIVANAPALSNPTGAAVGHAGAAGSVDTTGADGTLFYIATTNSTESVATVLAGSSQAVLGSGTQNVSVGGLTAETAYYLHYVHRSAAGVTSTRVSSAQFTTAATPVAGDNVAQTMSISIGLSL